MLKRLQLHSLLRRPFIASAFLVIIAMAACLQRPVRAANSPHSEACEAMTFEGSNFTACRYDARHHELRLMLDAPDGWPLRHLPALKNSLGEESKQARFAMNAGMYDRHGRPLGLYVEKGEMLKSLNREPGEGNFHLNPNGVLAVSQDGKVSITPSEHWPVHGQPPFYATQSGPMLLINRKLHPAFEDNGSSLHYRNGVGVVDSGSAWFVISEDKVSFGRFARLFRDRLNCRNALYLDGAVSSLWQPDTGRMDADYALGPMLLVSAK